MSFATFMFKIIAKSSDKKRDVNLIVPEHIQMDRDINYLGNNDKWNLLDVYYKKGTEGLQPTIISIHGGGYIYGTKEIYKHYGVYLAGLGFTFVNFNYHLAPKAKFPSQLTEINQVMEWVEENAEKYHIDINNIFIVGDSAGAQMCSHYTAIATNPDFEKEFAFTVPKEIKIRAIALNCGMYKFDLSTVEGPMVKMTKDMYKMYLGDDTSGLEKQIDVLSNITKDYPPTFVMTSYYDFLRANAEPMYQFLHEKGIEAEFKCYGQEGQEYMGHVCHVNMNLEEAKRINQDEAEFFKKYIV